MSYKSEAVAERNFAWSQAIYPWLVWFLSSSFFFYKYLVQVSPSVMTTDLMQAFHIHGAGLGNLSAFYFYAYLIMQIPVGILLDKYSPRYLTTLAILLCGVSTFIFAQTNSLWLACLSRAMIGFGAAFAAVSCFKLASLWFKPRLFALVSGMCMTAAMLGGVGGQLPLSLLVRDFGWRSALEIVAVLGIVLAIIYSLVIRDKSKKVISHDYSGPIFSNFWSILKNKQAWLLSLYSGLAFAPVSVFGGLWGVPFLEEAHQLSRPQAALVVSWIFVGFAAGAPLLGWMSDLIGRRKPIMYLGTLTALLSLSAVIYSSYSNMLLLSSLLFIFGFGASGFFISFAMIREVFPIMLAATVLGFMNTFDAVCEALSEPLVGALLDFTWGGAIENGVHRFSVHSYHLSLLLMPIYLLVSLVLLKLIDETYCRTKD